MTQEPWLLDINRHGVMRVPGVLWLGLAVLARHWMLLMMVGVSTRASKSTASFLGDPELLWPMLVAQMPVLLLMLAGARRAPDTGAWARLLWRHGRAIASVTAVLNIAWTAHMLWASDYWNPWPELFLGSLALIDAAVLSSMSTSPAYRQLFKEFPERRHEPSK